MKNSRKSIYTSKIKLECVSPRRNKKIGVRENSLLSLKHNNSNPQSNGRGLKNTQSSPEILVFKPNYSKFTIDTSLNDKIKKLELLTEKNLNSKYNWLDIEKRLIELSVSKKLKPISETDENQLKNNKPILNASEFFKILESKLRK